MAYVTVKPSTGGVMLSVSSFTAFNAAATVCPPHNAPSSTTGFNLSTKRPKKSVTSSGTRVTTAPASSKAMPCSWMAATALGPAESPITAANALRPNSERIHCAGPGNTAVNRVTRMQPAKAKPRYEHATANAKRDGNSPHYDSDQPQQGAHHDGQRVKGQIAFAAGRVGIADHRRRAIYFGRAARQCQYVAAPHLGPGAESAVGNPGAQSSNA